MSNAAVTPSMRAVAWNVHFTIGEDEDPGAFAGVYQVPGSNLVTFRNVCDELRLCFECPYDISNNESESLSQSTIPTAEQDTFRSETRSHASAEEAQSSLRVSEQTISVRVDFTH
ncbi:hypothetical protein ACHAPM_011483 [Fusarium culmorum]